jgi:hypothetical protein
MNVPDCFYMYGTVGYGSVLVLTHLIELENVFVPGYVGSVIAYFKPKIKALAHVYTRSEFSCFD